MIMIPSISIAIIKLIRLSPVHPALRRLFTRGVRLLSVLIPFLS